MKVWQAGSHLSEERGGKVGDWSWRQSRRRLATLVRLVLPYRARTIGAVVSLLAFTVVALVPPLLAKLAVDQGIKTGNLRMLVLIVAAFVVVGVATFGLSSLQTYLTGWVGERALADLRIKLFSHLQRLSLGYFERNRTGAIISRITNDVEALDTLITDGVTALVQNLMLLVRTAVVLFVLDWRLALATLSVLPLMALATIWFRVRSNRAYRRVRERIGLVTATLAEDIAGMRVVQSYAREPRNQVGFRGINSLYRDANYETIVLNGLYFPAVDFLASFATAIVLGYGGYLLPTIRSRLARCSRSSSTSRTSSIQSSSSRSSTTRSSRQPRRSTRSSRSSTRSPRSSTVPPLSSCRASTATCGSKQSDSATAHCRRCCTGSNSTCPPGRRSPSSARPAPASRRSRS